LLEGQLLEHPVPVIEDYHDGRLGRRLSIRMVCSRASRRRSDHVTGAVPTRTVIGIRNTERRGEPEPGVAGVGLVGVHLGLLDMTVRV
jgi:hypothetical protein